MANDWFNESTAPVFAAGGGGVWAVLSKDGTTKREAGAAVVSALIVGGFAVPGLAKYAGLAGQIELISTVSCLAGLLSLPIGRLLLSQFDRLAARLLKIGLKRIGIDDDGGPTP